MARCNPKVQCYAYEIVPENFICLWENVIANDLAGNVFPQLTGVGRRKGVITAPMTLGMGLLASSVALDSVSDDGVHIPVERLDDLHASFLGRAMMKIGVEGFESDVFHGGADFIRRVRPDIICEVLRRAPDIPGVTTLMKDNDYTFYHITNGGLIARPEIIPLKEERDWFFTHRGADELRARGFTVA